MCRPAISAAESLELLPPMLLQAVALVESGRYDPVAGTILPWPWAINAAGKGYYFQTKAEAVAAVWAFRRAGVMSIDVGCLQINLLQHPDAFTSFEEAFDPAANATYGARFLGRLFGETSAWPKAIAAYHSRTPGLGAAYAQHVLALWSPTHPPEPRLTEALGNRTRSFEVRLAQDAKDRAARLYAVRFGSILSAAEASSAENPVSQRPRRERL